ncbi:uncharacterized protein PV09_05772 [Verruconis gallopava]|uniref:Uncharacterized protein n=1 Tax=Verruconis gallopava TaxID=253628 RepID=A0A0D2A987_9PEZI|nr:uncharacterized protein PV09_05772 [Verruconis gallopava]KIW03130.1 hypothetical protein PV09_05772 [Verruconis gallopava]
MTSIFDSTKPRLARSVSDWPIFTRAICRTCASCALFSHDLIVSHQSTHGCSVPHLSGNDCAHISLREIFAKWLAMRTSQTGRDKTAGVQYTSVDCRILAHDSLIHH